MPKIIKRFKKTKISGSSTPISSSSGKQGAKKNKKPTSSTTKKKKLAGLEIAWANKKKLQEQGIEQKRRNPAEVLADNPTSIRKAINAMCYDCCGMELHVPRTRYCRHFTCPLWNVRPYSKNITKEQCMETDEGYTK